MCCCFVSSNRGFYKKKRLSNQLFLSLVKSQFMEEVFVKDKQKFLDEQPPPFGGHKLTDKVRCLHCDEVITVGDYKIFKEEGDDFLYICCPNAPECDGTIIDWIDVDANR